MQRHIFMGWDSRESTVYGVAAHSINRRTKLPAEIIPIKEKIVREQNLFDRPWIKDDNGQMYDQRDGKPFSTEFAFTRFLTPHLAAAQKLTGWVLFCDCDFLFLNDIDLLFKKYSDPTKAVYVVQHNFVPKNKMKMDNKLQYSYDRKLWSSFILWNLDHPSNKKLSVRDINQMPGHWLHGFRWLDDLEIGALPETWNWLPKISPTLPRSTDGKWEPSAIHFTEGGPWWENYKGIEFADKWELEYHHWVNAQFQPHIKRTSL